MSKSKFSWSETLSLDCTREWTETSKSKLRQPVIGPLNNKRSSGKSGYVGNVRTKNEIRLSTWWKSNAANMDRSLEECPKDVIKRLLSFAENERQTPC